MIAAPALILDANTATGAYLARLVHARGTPVLAVGDSDHRMAALGITDDVNRVATADAARAAGEAGTIYVIAGTDDAIIAETLAATAPGKRIAHVVDIGLLAQGAATRTRIAALRAARADGRHNAVNIILHGHDSRLGNADTLPARIIAAAWRATQGETLDIPAGTSQAGMPQDWGWTPEYVDAVMRIAALPRAIDLEIASGQMLTPHDIAAHALAYFRADAALLPSAPPVTAAMPINTAALKSVTGWSAITHGRDLVRTLCDGHAARA